VVLRKEDEVNKKPKFIIEKEQKVEKPRQLGDIVFPIKADEPPLPET